MKTNWKNKFKVTAPAVTVALTATLLATFAPVAKSDQDGEPGVSDFSIPEIPASNGIKVVGLNGDTSVFYHGKRVWKGRTSNKVTAKATSIDGRTYAAAFDGDKVIWETEDGAAKAVGGAAVGMGIDDLLGEVGAGGAGGIDPAELLKKLRSDFDENPGGLQKANHGIKVHTEGDLTTIFYRGEEVWQGPTEGGVIARTTSVDGKDYAAAFAGDTLIWESEKGAAEKVGR